MRTTPTRIAILVVGATIAYAGAVAGAASSMKGPGVANHPVGIVPSDRVTIPAGWPLDAAGAITCATCHTRVPTESAGGDPRLRGLKAANGVRDGFCANCHEFDQRDASSIHWLAVGAAHVGRDRFDADDGIEALDEQTRRCLSCHDGAVAGESNNGTPWNRSIGGMGDEARNHPVGVRYGRTSRSKHASPLRPASHLPAEVRLPGGKVGCVSCHDLYAGSRYLLTVPTRGSQLCLTCHAMS